MKLQTLLSKITTYEKSEFGASERFKKPLSRRDGRNSSHVNDVTVCEQILCFEHIFM